MGKKSKEGSVNLYYLKSQNEKKSKSISNNDKKKVKSLEKNVKNKKSKETIKDTKKPKNEKFNFDEEIVIGVTKFPDSKKKNEKKKDNNKKEKKNITNKKVQAKKKIVTNKKNKEKLTKKIKIFKYFFIISVLLAALICFMLSPIFNISEIKINGNSYISSEQIISLSEIKVGENTFKINKNKTNKNLKQNAYIENIEVKRKLPSIVEINIKERQATYMLEYLNSYVYINNQGYMLEISEQKIDKPILIGISTNLDDIKPGNRLVENDLTKLESVLKIIESASSNEIERLINKIDISDKSNYILYMDTDGKTAKLGDITDIGTKMLHIKAILERNEGLQGEIIVDSVSENNKSRFIQKVDN